MNEFQRTMEFLRALDIISNSTEHELREYLGWSEEDFDLFFLAAIREGFVVTSGDGTFKKTHKKLQ